MRVVIDTNVLVSAALKNKDPEAVIKWIVAHPDWLWLVTPEILSEYQAVLRRPKFGLPRDLLDRWLALLDAVTTPVVADPPIKYPRDQKDAIFLACAVAGQADYLHRRQRLHRGAQARHDDYPARVSIQAPRVRRNPVMVCVAQFAI